MSGAGLAIDTSATLAVGSSRLQVRAPSRRPAALSPVRAGVRLVNRSPRVVRSVQPRTFTLPSAPDCGPRPRLPWVAMVAPIPLGVVLAVFFSPVMLAFTLMTPLMMGATALSDRIQGRRSYAAQLAEHARAVARVRAAATAAVAEERRLRRRLFPDPAEILAVAAAPWSRLWERRRGDVDMLELRLGTWTARSQVAMADPGNAGSPLHLEAPGSPCTVALGTTGVLGISGPRGDVEGVVRCLLGQVATLHSPRDVEIWVVAARRTECAAWQWVSRLPHNRSADSPTQRRVVAMDDEGPALVMALRDLLAVVDERRQQLGPGTTWRGQRCVVLLDGAGQLREAPGLARLLEEGPSVGMVFIALDSDVGRLPSESRAVVRIADDSRGCHLLADGDAAGHTLTVDRVGPWWSDRLSRALAPLRDASPEEAEGQLSSSARLVDLLPCNALDPREVAAWWADAPSATRATVGLGPEGPHQIDLRRDGPHVLVGGTTGSGKSEFLQTLITSLAVTSPPDRLAFVLVDYKGGAAFKECASLPHTTGLVTDLDEHLTSRALTSLNAELKRREALFSAVGAKDLDDWDVRRSEGAVVPRLVIVIDEFRALAEELPEFLSGLVRIASVGRSLGVHLVLATQRPAGVVSADIKANVNLRVALRMRDRADSEDVIDSPAAARISERTPGRALSRTGSGPPRTFQVARVGGPASAAAPGLRLFPLDWRSAVRLPPPLDGPSTQTATGPGLSGDVGTCTDLTAVAATLREAAAISGIRTAPSPWLPPLPDVVTPEELHDGVGSPSNWEVVVGLADRPAQQQQEPLCWDLRRSRHRAVVGTNASGRTSLLRLVAAQGARQLSPAVLHLYAVDGGAGGLQGLSVLPHTGAVVARDDHGRVERLVRRLAAEVASRQKVMAQHGFSSLTDWHEAAGQSGIPLTPALMLLLIDDWDAVVQTLDATDHGALTGQLLALLRDAGSAGLRAVVTGDRALLMGRAASLFAERLVLRLADPADAVLAGLHRSPALDRVPAGRVVRPDGEQVQLAWPGTPAHQADALAATARRWADRCAAATGLQSPMRVDPLPHEVGLDAVLESAGGSGPALPLGLGGDDLRPVGLCPTQDGPLWLVAGPARSGRSSALLTLGTLLLRSGRRLAVVSTRPGPLDTLRERDGVVCWTWADDLDDLVAARQHDPDLAVLVDDADQLLDTPADAVLRRIAGDARRGRGLVACAASTATLLTQYRGIAIEVARAQTGILLSPQGMSDGELFGVRAPRALERVPGRGLLTIRGSVTEIQLARTAATSTEGLVAQRD